MTKRRKWTAIPGFFALAAAAAVLSAYSGASSSEGRAPDQPVAFPHPKHAGAVSQGGLGMNCVYCHFAANKSPDPGMPAVSTCMGCHTVIGPNRPGGRRSEAIAKLTQYWTEKKPVPWVRIHKVPDYVQFPHMRHVNAGVTCQACHGDVQDMPRVYQAASLNMGWCVRCHLGEVRPEWKARYDCSNCHF